MYNAVVNDWQDVEHQITFDVRQPKTHAYTMKRLRKFIMEHPYVNVIRYTTFFHQFTLVFDELAREKYVDWYGYSASVSPYILEQFEKEAGYPFRPEYIIDQGYYNNTYRIPPKEFRDFQAFQPREVAKIAKAKVEITHECGKAAMMFQGNWAIPNIQKANPDVNLDMFALPVTNDESKNAIISGIDVMPTIYKETKEEELAKDFISFIFRDDKVKAYIEDQFAFPSVDTVVQDNASVAGVAEKFAQGNIGDFADHYYPTGFDFTVTLQTFVSKQGDVEEFLKKLDKEYDKYNSF